MDWEKDIWIINNGVVIFSQSSGDIIDEQFFTAYLNAIEQFSSQLTSSGVEEFELGAKRFVLKRNEELLFIVTAPQKVKQKKVQKEVDRIENLFLKNFPIEFFKGWDGNIEIFKGFSEKIEENEDDIISNFEESVW